jgi:hypothetical protein
MLSGWGWEAWTLKRRSAVGFMHHPTGGSESIGVETSSRPLGWSLRIRWRAYLMRAVENRRLLANMALSCASLGKEEMPRPEEKAAPGKETTQTLVELVTAASDTDEQRKSGEARGRGPWTGIQSRTGSAATQRRLGPEDARESTSNR